MSQKSTKFDEFASLFRSVVRPHLEVDPLPFKRLLVVMDFQGNQERAQGAPQLARDMTDSFKTETHLLCPLRKAGETLASAQKECDALREAIQAKGATVSTKVDVGHPATQILEEIEAFDPDLIVIPNLFGEKDDQLEGFSLGAVVDKVLSSTPRPILLLEGSIADTSALWSDILVFVEEASTTERCLAITRTLAEKEAAVRLLHVIDSNMLRIVEHAFELTTELDTQVATAALQKALRKDMDHFLQGAKELLDRTGHHTTYDILMGDPVETCRNYIQEKGPHLVVCNSVAPNQRLVDSVAYNLAAYLQSTPLLLV